MKKQICLIILLFTCRICTAQNLVPNPSFEDTLFCPTYFSNSISIPPDQTTLAPPWHMTTYGSSDYFNACASDSFVGVPKNFFGYQQARTGLAYMGLFSKMSLQYREYISAPLLDTLMPGVIYYASVYVNLAFHQNISNTHGTDGMGIYFSHGSPDTTGVNGYYLPDTPQVSNPNGNVLSDTINWVKISGSFVAIGNEDYITIGNFKDDGNTIGQGYYFVDDVCISTDSLTCNSIVKINEIKKEEENALFPNPFDDKLNAKVKTNEQAEIILYDIAARKILQQKFTNSVSLNTEQLAKGLYLYEVRCKDGSCKKGKVVKD